ncbi:MAG: cysteine--tRNA ligase [Armatimonadota bacterium]|nr:MAG: cysteine--tRNA ligase [Armatimonadota bacterium]
MSLVIYSTLTRHKEPFVPREPGRVRMYVCGPTVYGYVHVGNGRMEVSFDAIRRYLEYAGYEVTMVRNITDVDDKIINAANDEGVTSDDIARRYTQAYFEDMAALGVRRADHEPRATEYIEQMIRLTSTLTERGYAYPLDGDVYFEVRKFQGYGELSGRDVDEMMAGARVEVDERKRDPLDFALWKSSKPGEPAWDSPWGPGRPGWHIECSAMSGTLLGEELDIHGGGADLIFPHHENERAQSEAATGHAPFVRYWMHVGWLTVEHRKMSKSLGNFSTVRDVLAHYPAQALRFLFLSTHYRQQLEFTDGALDQARSALERLLVGREHLERMISRAAAGEEGDGPLEALDTATDAARESFSAAMDDDFNTPRALAALFQLVAEAHRLADERFVPTRAQRPSFEKALSTLRELSGVLGLALEAGRAQDQDLTSKLTQILVNVRQRARETGDYALADSIRAELAKLGITLEDRPDGTSWRQS